jgi:acyl-CoA thioester hydrolase
MIQCAISNWRVSYADTDAGGVVYHGRYIEQAERSRQQYLLDADLTFADLEKEYDCLLVVRAIDASYENPAFLDQKLLVTCAIRELRESFSVWETLVENEHMQLCSIKVKIVCMSAKRRKLRTMPDALLGRLSTYAFHTL